MKPIFDARWHKRALAGDADAAETLTDAVIKPLYRFCLYRVGGKRHLCEDVVQDTLVRAICELDNYDPRRSGGEIFPWLVGLARNEIRRALKATSSAASLEALWQRMDKELLSLFAKLSGEPFADELLQRAETREMVNATMSQLPPRYSRALEAKYVVGQTVAEIATAWRVSEKAMESQLTRARKAFRGIFLTLAKNLNPETNFLPSTQAEG